MKITHRTCIAIACYAFILFFLLIHVSSATAESRGELTPKGQKNSVMWFQETITWPGTLTGGSSTTFAIFRRHGNGNSHVSKSGGLCLEPNGDDQGGKFELGHVKIKAEGFDRVEHMDQRDAHHRKQLDIPTFPE